MWPRNLPLTCTTMAIDGGLQCRGIDRRPGLIDQRGADGPERATAHASTCGMMGESPSTAISKASCTTLRSCGRALRKLGQCVQQLHGRGDRGVESAAAADIVGDLRQGLVRLAPQRPLRVVQRRLVERRGQPCDT